jgi:hypothetical protein
MSSITEQQRDKEQKAKRKQKTKSKKRAKKSAIATSGVTDQPSVIFYLFMRSVSETHAEGLHFLFLLFSLFTLHSSLFTLLFVSSFAF